MRPVGVLCAIPQEFAFLADNLTGAEVTECAGMVFHAGRLDGHQVVLARAGMGKVNAAIAATLLLERFECRLLLFSGIAGGLDPALSVGDVVIADHVVQHDAGYYSPDEAFVVYQAGHLPFFSPYEGLGHAADGELIGRVRTALADLTLAPLSATGGERAPRLHYGRILTGDQFINAEAPRERLFRELGGAAVEMEGAAMAQVASAFATPWLVVRTLSDLAGRESHFDFRLFIDEVALSSALVVRRLLPVL
ncbi:5'-methylthioadenosine/adenosylhomocysteine nucleosidase [Ancylobacter dichloromethanicus]|uniref:adenosylhomocysteine nucleosidase n=1 Tax=Ancylobacter dichloromethanicus TaxID=518825 RepID=A0A9W6J8I7_9HYPH|nr:5'-methylthioadenosine/adenosylhomocysteine nucleosidase [Ancylobacter dichloromethanicus]MBS7554127.1 5'-methylthioadenosine/adenosylhomocysteine nucleosidase [Ancylobacter dichloromethanicus]GLK71243.1 5'-methylthioadenosine/S-adenosylhomocysteine nucleosidase [Ancylobacter dichloromethanicus]